MPPPKDKPNPLATPSDDFTVKIHSDSYEAIDPSSADFTGKYVFIVGGTKGIGKSITLSYAKAGASAIAIGGRSRSPGLAEEIEKAATGAGKGVPKIVQIQVDVRSEEAVANAAAQIEQELGRLDIMVFNSGILSRGVVGDSDPNVWWDTFTINVRGPYLMARALLPLMLKDGDKQMAFVSSVGALLLSPGLSAYQTSKMTLLRLVEFIAKEYQDRGVVAYCIHPGNVPETDIMEGGVPDALKHVFTETPQLAGDTLVYLTREKRDWLAGRYISCTWDMPELMAKEKEIVDGDKLKMKLVL